MDLNKNMLELSRSRHATEQLQKQLTARDSSHREIVESLKSTQSNMVRELTQNGSVLARLLDSESSTLAK